MEEAGVEEIYDDKVDYKIEQARMHWDYYGTSGYRVQSTKKT